jgi:hypothetical protein
VVQDHPEITPPSNFHQLRDTTPSPIAEVVCAQTGDLYTRLETRMGSKRIATGLRGREQIMEVWSDNRGEWVMVVTYASGESCIVAMGEDWMPVGPAPARG